MGYFLDKAKSIIQDKDLETMPAGIECEKSVKSEITLKSPTPSDSMVIPGNCRLKYPDAPADDQELLEIENRVLTKGYVLLWSNTLNDFVAFYKMKTDREKIPPGFVLYSDQELRELFGKGKSALSPRILRLIHQAQKEFGTVEIDRSAKDAV